MGFYGTSDLYLLVNWPTTASADAESQHEEQMLSKFIYAYLNSISKYHQMRCVHTNSLALLSSPSIKNPEYKVYI